MILYPLQIWYRTSITSSLKTCPSIFLNSTCRTGCLLSPLLVVHQSLLDLWTSIIILGKTEQHVLLQTRCHDPLSLCISVSNSFWHPLSNLSSKKINSSCRTSCILTPLYLDKNLTWICEEITLNLVVPCSLHCIWCIIRICEFTECRMRDVKLMSP